MSVFSRTRDRTGSQADFNVPEKIIRRVRRVPVGTEKTWVDQTLYLIGTNVTHHQPGDPLLDEAITSAQATLALLVEMRNREWR